MYCICIALGQQSRISVPIVHITIRFFITFYGFINVYHRNYSLHYQYIIIVIFTIYFLSIFVIITYFVNFLINDCN